MVTAEEAAYLTDRARGVATRTLPSSEFLVLTRESMEALLPPGTKLADCLSGGCEVEVGRRLGVDYIVTGEVLKFGEGLRLNLKAYHCSSGAFVGNEAAAGAKVDQLDKDAIDASGRLFARIRSHADPTGVSEGQVGEVGRAPWVAPSEASSVVSLSPTRRVRSLLLMAR